MKAEKIKKALECCGGDIVECQKCAYVKNGYGRCKERTAQDALALIKQLTEDKCNLEYTLLGVMHSVDKWLDGAELEQDEVNRAATMREKTLQIVERLTEENERLKSVEFTCGFIKPHKVLECPIFDEIVKAKADTVREMQSEIKYRCIKGGVYPAFVARTIDQIAKEMLEDNQ